MNDKKVAAAAVEAVRIIIRRPHAYKVRAQYRKAPIPGLLVLDPKGKFLGGVALPSVDAAQQVAELLRR